MGYKKVKGRNKREMGLLQEGRGRVHSKIAILSHPQRNSDGKMQTTALSFSPSEKQPIKEASLTCHIRIKVRNCMQSKSQS